MDELLDGVLFLLNSLQTLNPLSPALEPTNPTTGLVNPRYTTVSLAGLNGMQKFRAHSVVQ